MSNLEARTLLTCRHTQSRICPLLTVETHGLLHIVLVSLEDIFDLSVSTVVFAPPGCYKYLNAGLH